MKTQNLIVRWAHRYPTSSQKTAGTVTICEIQNQNKERITEQRVTLHNGDTFDRRKGNIIALTLALKKLERNQRAEILQHLSAESPKTFKAFVDYQNHLKARGKIKYY